MHALGSPSNDEMQRTAPGQDGAPPLISVFDGSQGVHMTSWATLTVIAVTAAFLPAIADSSKALHPDVTDAEWEAAVPATEVPDWRGVDLRPPRPKGDTVVPVNTVQTVRFDVVYRTSGAVGLYRVKETSYQPFADQVAAWLRSARFKPVRRNGKVIAVREEFSFSVERRSGN